MIGLHTVVGIQFKPFNVYFLICRLRKLLSLHRRHVDRCIRGANSCGNRVLIEEEKATLVLTGHGLYTPWTRRLYSNDISKTRGGKILLYMAMIHLYINNPQYNHWQKETLIIKAWKFDLLKVYKKGMVCIHHYL